jgi:murein L,D-transpeptidase YcbB/YkuD
MTSTTNFIVELSGARRSQSRDANRRTPGAGNALFGLCDAFLRRARVGLLMLAALHASAVDAAQPPASDPVAEALRARLDQLIVSDGGSSQSLHFAAPDVLERFYEKRGFEPAWDDARARAFIAIVRDAPSHGLSPADYLIDALDALPPPSTLTDTERIDADLTLTEAFLRYAYHRRFGKVDPHMLDPSWNYARNVLNPFAALERILAAPDLGAQLEEEVGHGPMYESMRIVLARYKGYAANGGWRAVPAGPTLKPDGNDARVPALRARLAAEGFAAQTSAQPNAYDDALVAAVRAFQTHHGLNADGVVGARTLEELNVSAAALVDRLRVNLERLRWVLVERAPRFVGINIAGFRVYYVEDDHPLWTARAVVGKPFRETPVFRADMKYLVLNPDWTVPPTILRQDALPAIRRDVHYLKRQNMDVIDRNGRIVDPSTIDWAHVTARTFPYLLRQRPGPTNALGRIKFMFPNPHAVFLHDTPSRELFQREVRLFSSGCIRVEHPFELADILLKDDPRWTPDVVRATVDSGVTQTVSLPHPIPVLVLYLTAVAFDDGRDFSFYGDVYGRDRAVLDALNAGFVYSPPKGL